MDELNELFSSPEPKKSVSVAPEYMISGKNMVLVSDVNPSFRRSTILKSGEEHVSYINEVSTLFLIDAESKLNPLKKE